jgi:hypothetical protein
VEEKGGLFENLNTGDFETRRINFTFRFVPDEHIKQYKSLPLNLKEDIQNYVKTLSSHSEYWMHELTQS